MKDTLLQTVKEFLEVHWAPGRPVVLALSGGPDSKALFHLVLDCRKFIPLDLHLAHIDHSWRTESAQEAEILLKEAEVLGLPFHLCRLEPRELPGCNLEAHGRQARLAFFKKVYQEIGAQSLMLAHQADDHAETVLKRVFEGSHLRQAGGMSPIGAYEGMALWRPLLACPKRQLLESLSRKGIGAFQDPTNEDPRFLRGRMRKDLLPMLSEVFGKEVSGNLCRLGRTADELSVYFSKKLAPCFSSISRGPWGVHWDLSAQNLDKIEWEYLLKEWLNREGLELSRDLFQDTVLFLEMKTPDRRCGPLFLDRGHLFWVQGQLPIYGEPVGLKEGSVELELGPYRWEGVVAARQECSAPSGWRDFWEGRIAVCLPDGDYELGSFGPSIGQECRKTLLKRWSDAKVPGFLRPSAPLILQKGIVVHDFLSGKINFKVNSKSFKFISLKIKVSNK